MAVRFWLVFFGPCERPWCHLLPKNFGHVMAAGYDSDLKLWVFYDPKRSNTLIEILPVSEVDAIEIRLGLWRAACKPNILRIEQRYERHISPPLFSCVGAIKGLLGIRSRALLPRGLYRDLVRRGAELVEVSIAAFPTARSSAGRPGGRAPAQAGAGAG